MIVVRCPKCGSTDAGEDGGRVELTRMVCNACKYEELADHYTIKDEWNVETELAEGQPLPAFCTVGVKVP